MNGDSKTVAEGIDTRVADTIAAQISGYNKLRAMLGVYAFLINGDSLAFTFKARSINGANRVEVTLCADDTYLVAFQKVGMTMRTATKLKQIELVDGVHAEQLREVIEDKLGLRVSL